MKISNFLKAFSLVVMLTICSKVSFSQENKITAEVHSLLLDNVSKDKIIQIRFHNCSKNEFENLYKKGLLNTNLPAFSQAYSSEDDIGSIHFSKPTEITTSDIKLLLNALNISKVLFDEKKILVSDLTKYQFLVREKSITNERTEK